VQLIHLQVVSTSLWELGVVVGGRKGIYKLAGSLDMSEKTVYVMGLGEENKEKLDKVLEKCKRYVPGSDHQSTGGTLRV
jgi:hypothetical protein